ncbi:thermonuclease family protein [Peribacillus frigoritolerans]|uniref:thermonuclease family protein n=1 Tax=Peribacillus frigoritolerans TaxID=450367 RepID=UPI0020798446|nr:thermonuclease family protein [Peribacillus frigoritolerans]USK77736.1 thermonuclease family protein [Peribacillus frigoritolerans]USK77815.1 thermonuclease family protein [Peribacillus frigoritolerans]USK77854.1 thermonuclease family protein [Peribacillus frigoritolerans]
MRLLGIDTPERHQKGYSEATQFVVKKCLGKPVQISTYEKDSFGRWLSVVRVNGENLNELLLSEGFAVQYESV